ncbi:MAG: polysaccharide biosynthesis/export family protein [Bacteroidetes bacterium]|nr:polysaccharide biosynthesis/export family protein [Bacteroidota bacterium]MBS1630835.1 polysaccharide biosynthesis/export family protein [Bacteroidota bacterium]
MIRSFFQALPLACLLFLCACGSVRKTVYFRDDAPQQAATTEQVMQKDDEATIQPNDILAINVASITFYKEGQTSQVFLDGGLPYSGGNPASGGGETTGSGRNTYLVDSVGYIDYPRVGKLKLAGLSTREAKNLLAEKLKDYLFQPAIEVRILNYRITMLGDVGREGPIYVSNHKVSIVDALAAAGGIPITGRKDNVLVIREVGNKRMFARLDLNSRNVFNNPYYFLKQNDIVYVEPSKIRRQEANTFLRFYLPIVTSFITTALSVYTIVLVNNRR